MFKQFSRNIKLLVYHDDIPGFTKTGTIVTLCAAGIQVDSSRLGAESLKYYDVVVGQICDPIALNIHALSTSWLPTVNSTNSAVR